MNGGDVEQESADLDNGLEEFEYLIPLQVYIDGILVRELCWFKIIGKEGTNPG